MSARVIMVASGKGGTGKSTVSVLTGAALAARGHRVLLVELDSALRSVDYIAGEHIVRPAGHSQAHAGVHPVCAAR